MKNSDFWSVVYTRPRYEKKVSNELSLRKIEHLFPQILDFRVRRNKKIKVESPLFPQYLFVNLQDKHEYYSCCEIGGLCYFIRNGKELARVSKNVIDQITVLKCQPEGVRITYEQLEIGRKVLITNGPLMGMECEVIKYSGKQRIIVRIESLARSLLVDLSMTDIINNH